MDYLTILMEILKMKKQEGFKDQRSIIIPELIVNEFKENIISKQLYLTDIGFYPNAKFHQRTRNKGCGQYILIYCIKGEGWFSVDGEKTTISENQFFIIPPKTPHAYGSRNENSWSIYWIHFSGEMAPHFYDPAKKTKTISPSKIARIDERIQLFEEIMQNLEMGYSNENMEYINICLLHFLASFKYINQFRQIRRVRERDVIENIIFFMRENLHIKLNLQDIANESMLSVSHFSLLFRKKTGRAPMEYLIYLRTQKACQLLDHSELQVKEISRKVGFEDPYYFSRIFKKVMGTSPQNYRGLLKG